MYKIYKKNNYLIIDDSVTTPEEYLTKDILIKEIVTNVTYEIYGILPRLGNTSNQLLYTVNIANIIKEDDSPYTANEWVDFYTSSTGVPSSNSGGGSGGAGDASATNQIISNTKLTNIESNTTDLPNVIAMEGGAQPSKGVVVMGHTGAGIVKHILVDSNGVQSVNVNNSALPTGGATSAKQDLGNTSLDNIDNKTPALIDGATPISDNGKSITVDYFNEILRDAFQTFPNTKWTVRK